MCAISVLLHSSRQRCLYDTITVASRVDKNVSRCRLSGQRRHHHNLHETKSSELHPEDQG